ncbi:MAG: NosD domain-containing protein [Candidatus Freyarchaeum deiterrae]
MKSIRRNKKALKITAVLAAVLLTATIVTAVTAIQNRNTVPLINLYLQGVSPSPSNAIIQPKTIPMSGYNILNGSVYYDSITVTANNTVIDGNGSTVQGSGTGYGFYLNGVSNVTIYNVAVTGWDYGFYLSSSSNNNLSGNTANNNANYYGFYLYSSSNNNTLSSNTANSNWVGFVLDSSSNNTLLGNTAHFNTAAGFALGPSSNNNTLSGNTATDSLDVYSEGFGLGSSSYNNLSGNTAEHNTRGFYLYGGSNNNLSGNTANENIGYRDDSGHNTPGVGFFLTSTLSNILSGNTAYDSQWAGFWLTSGSNYNNLSGNNANNWPFTPAVYGFEVTSGETYLVPSSYNTLSGNTANNNQMGFYLYDGSGNNNPGNNLSGNNATNNNNNGFLLEGSSNNNLTNNTANNNGGNGFVLYSTVDPAHHWWLRSNNNILSGNTANNNNEGFYVYQSLNNTLLGNKANNNRHTGFHLYGGSNNNNLSGNNATNNNNYGFYLETNSFGNNLPGNIALNCTTGGYNWSGDCINNNFTGSVEAYYLRVNVTDVLGSPISGVDVNVVTDGTSVYRSSHFGGTDPPTGSNGVTSWIAVAYRTFITSDTMTENTTNATVYYQGRPISGSNPRTVNMSTSQVETFIVDTTPLTVNITSPTNGTLFNTGSVTATWTVSVPSIVDHYEVRIEGGNWNNMGTSTSNTFSGLFDGSHTVDVMVFDLAGNNANASVFFTVDTTPPTVSITSPTNDTLFNTSGVTVTWTGSDALSGIAYFEVSTDGVNWSNVTTSFSYNFTGLSDGSHTVDVRAWDLAGNNANASVSFTVASVQPGQSQAMLLALLSLAGTLGGGTSPLVYAAIIGVVGVGVVAAGLIYYFRKVNA